jgi:hypothetical protein
MVGSFNSVIPAFGRAAFHRVEHELHLSASANDGVGSTLVVIA